MLIYMIYNLTSLLSQFWDLVESWHCGGVALEWRRSLVDSLGGGYLHVAFDPSTINLFNISLIAQSTPS